MAHYKDQFTLPPKPIRCSFELLKTRIILSSNSRKSRVVNALMFARLSGANLSVSENGLRIMGEIPDIREKTEILKIIKNSHADAARLISEIYI